MRISEMFPQHLIDELLRLYNLDPNWASWTAMQDQTYGVTVHYKTWVRELWQRGSDGLAMKALSHWLGSGPKVFKPTKQQCDALENVDVNLLLEDYAQPYPALMVLLDYPPFTNVLCYHEPQCLVCCLHSRDHEDDIVTTISTTTDFVEVSLEKFDKDCQLIAPTACKALRVACNSCLALVNYGSYLKYLFSKEVERDRSLTRCPGKRLEVVEAARKRIRLAVQVASFSQEVRLHKTEEHTNESTPSGRFCQPHWRRGHWAMQAHGPGRLLRKRILRPPVLVRADLFIGEPSQTTATYRQ